MRNTINERLIELRKVMRREHLSAFIFPSTDPHQGEYIPDRWKGREWISGFNGSAGVAVVTMTSAALWTDSRYFLAATECLKGTEFQLMKLKLPGTPTIEEWLGEELRHADSPEVGIDGWVASHAFVKSLEYGLRQAGGMTLRINFDPLQEIWRDRPGIPSDEIYVQPMKYAGVSAKEKLARIRKSLGQRRVDGLLVSALDDVAWTLNLRGSDVHCNPVFVGYLLVTMREATLFVDQEKVPEDVSEYLREQGVSVADYDGVKQALGRYFEYNILLDPDETSSILAASVNSRSLVVYGESPIPAMKIVKNEVEIEGFRNAMLKDGIAMVKFLKWLKPAVAAGGQTEMSVDEKLTSLRAAQPLFRGVSFDTIAGYEEHGAIVHYEATPETDKQLLPKGFLLLDSGAQYQDGTTDITRTIPLGEITDEQRHIYTLVLKGHIQIELCKFPAGSSGTQLDILARHAMWKEGYNYLHGTGHGVGSFLNVHEGPHQLRLEWKPQPFVKNMTVTDEPGIYLAGKFGVRIENTLLMVPYKTTEFGEFLQFESLTLCPIDTDPIDMDMMTEEEIAWLNDYHKMVYDKLSPWLDEEEQRWLKEATKPLASK